VSSSSTEPRHDEAVVAMPQMGVSVAEGTLAVWHKRVGDWVDFGGLLGRAPVIAVNTRSAERLIARGGRIPSPLQALIN